MRWFDLVLAAVCIVMGVRSAVYWLRQPLDSTVSKDHALFALFLVARVGTWLSLAAWFAGLAAIAASVENETFDDRSVPEQIRTRYGWIFVAFLAANGIAFLASYFLSRRAGPAPPHDDPRPEGEPRPAS